MKQVIALDIGGTNTRLAIVDEEYNILKQEIRPTVLGDKQAFLDSIKSIIQDNVQDFSAYCAIASGVPGRVDPFGHIDVLPNIGIEDIALANILHDLTGLPAFVKNDAEVACIAEANVGPFKDAKSLYFVTISTGIGGALARGGILCPSSNEPGHVLVDYEGALIELERIASGNGLTRLAKSKGMYVDNTKEFFEVYARHNPMGEDIFATWMGYLSTWFKMTRDAFEPDVFVLTGGVMKSKDLFLDELRKACPECNIQECGCGQNAGLLGAAALGFKSI